MTARPRGRGRRCRERKNQPKCTCQADCAYGCSCTYHSNANGVCKAVCKGQRMREREGVCVCKFRRERRREPKCKLRLWLLSFLRLQTRLRARLRIQLLRRVRLQLPRRLRLRLRLPTIQHWKSRQHPQRRQQGLLQQPHRQHQHNRRQQQRKRRQGRVRRRQRKRESLCKFEHTCVSGSIQNHSNCASNGERDGRRKRARDCGLVNFCNCDSLRAYDCEFNCATNCVCQCKWAFKVLSDRPLCLRIVGTARPQTKAIQHNVFPLSCNITLLAPSSSIRKTCQPHQTLGDSRTLLRTIIARRPTSGHGNDAVTDWPCRTTSHSQQLNLSTSASLTCTIVSPHLVPIVIVNASAVTPATTPSLSYLSTQATTASMRATAVETTMVIPAQHKLPLPTAATAPVWCNNTPPFTPPYSSSQCYGKAEPDWHKTLAQPPNDRVDSGAPSAIITIIPTTQNGGSDMDMNNHITTPVCAPGHGTDRRKSSTTKGSHPLHMSVNHNKRSKAGSEERHPDMHTEQATRPNDNVTDKTTKEVMDRCLLDLPSPSAVNITRLMLGAIWRGVVAEEQSTARTPVVQTHRNGCGISKRRCSVLAQMTRLADNPSVRTPHYKRSERLLQIFELDCEMRCAMPAGTDRTRCTRESQPLDKQKSGSVTG